jgi:hypothetical protein
MRCCPERCNGAGKGGCCGPNGPCRYFIFLFYAVLYMFLVVVYVRRVHPFVVQLYPETIEFHSVLTYLVLPWPWLIVLLLHFYDPGEITRENVNSYLKEYPPDNVLYHPHICRTLRIPVPARSRYCRYTNRRVARYDHYCPGMLATIGERSRRFFLLFLITNTIAASYYGYNSLMLLRWAVKMQPVKWPNTFWTDLYLWILIAVRLDRFIFSSMVLLWGISISLVFFVGQQMWIISGNVTQLEMDKIGDWKKKQEITGKNAEYVHAYDHGFWRNWKECLWPKRMEKHAPVQLCEVPGEEKRERVGPVGLADPVLKKGRGRQAKKPGKR